MVDGEYIFAIFLFSFFLNYFQWSALLDITAGKIQLHFPFSLLLSPLTTASWIP